MRYSERRVTPDSLKLEISETHVSRSCRAFAASKPSRPPPTITACFTSSLSAYAIIELRSEMFRYKKTPRVFATLFREVYGGRLAVEPVAMIHLSYRNDLSLLVYTRCCSGERDVTVSER